MGIIEHLAKGNIGRAIHTAVYPPADVYWIDGNLQVKVDMAGFDHKDIDMHLDHNILRIEATRNSTKDDMKEKNKKIKFFSDHRPLEIDARIPLPFNPFEDKCKDVQIADKATYVNGVLTLNIVGLPKKIIVTPENK